ncbi:hypothetical protein QN277_024464 [Acacia crassicarpa]|nr:hypothetical protein QN277_024464 [Acacia crassicarpa]
MSDHNKCTIWKFLGGVSAMSGLGCFGLSSTYKILFGKLGICGLLVYLLISSIMLRLIYFVKKIRVTNWRVQVVVATLLLVVICLISAELDKLVPGKSDALSIISYGLFAILSLCASRKSELGFETGFFTFFVSLFLEQIYKTSLILFPIAVIFCLVILVLRHRPQSVSSNGDGDNSDEESQYFSVPSTSSQDPAGELYEAPHSPRNNGGVSEEIRLEVFRDDDPEETRPPFPARHRLPSNDGQVSEENISDGGNEQNNEQEEVNTSFLAAESSYSDEQDHVSSTNHQNSYVHIHPSPEGLRRRGRMTRAIQNISSSLGDTLRRCHPPRPFSFFVFFFTKFF